MPDALTLFGGGSLVHYEQARVALAECAKVDDAAKIKDKAEKLAAYARMRDDADMEVWVSEIKLRAGIRIGELSLQLEIAKPNGRGPVSLPSGGKRKAEALADAGLSTSTAARYEELAGGREKQGQKVAAVAADKYFAEQRKAQTPATLSGLKTAVREAVHATVGAPPPRATTTKRDPTYTAWIDWVSAVRQVADLNDATFAELAKQTRKGDALDTTLKEARRAATRLERWITSLAKEADRG